MKTRREIESKIAAHQAATSLLRRELLTFQKSAPVECPHCDGKMKFSELILVIPHTYQEPSRHTGEGRWVEAWNKRYCMCPLCTKTFYEANMPLVQKSDFETTPGIFGHRIRQFGEQYRLIQISDVVLDQAVTLPALPYLRDTLELLRRESLMSA